MTKSNPSYESKEERETELKKDEYIDRHKEIKYNKEKDNIKAEICPYKNVLLILNLSSSLEGAAAPHHHRRPIHSLLPSVCPSICASLSPLPPSDPPSHPTNSHLTPSSALFIYLFMFIFCSITLSSLFSYEG